MLYDVNIISRSMHRSPLTALLGYSSNNQYAYCRVSPCSYPTQLSHLFIHNSKVTEIPFHLCRSSSSNTRTLLFQFIFITTQRAVEDRKLPLQKTCRGPPQIHTLAQMFKCLTLLSYHCTSSMKQKLLFQSQLITASDSSKSHLHCSRHSAANRTPPRQLATLCRVAAPCCTRNRRRAETKATVRYPCWQQPHKNEIKSWSDELAALLHSFWAAACLWDLEQLPCINMFIHNHSIPKAEGRLQKKRVIRTFRNPPSGNASDHFDKQCRFNLMLQQSTLSAKGLPSTETCNASTSSCTIAAWRQTGEYPTPHLSCFRYDFSTVVKSRLCSQTPTDIVSDNLPQAYCKINKLFVFLESSNVLLVEQRRRNRSSNGLQKTAHQLVESFSDFRHAMAQKQAKNTRHALLFKTLHTRQIIEWGYYNRSNPLPQNLFCKKACFRSYSCAEGGLQLWTKNPFRAPKPALPDKLTSWLLCRLQSS